MRLKEELLLEINKPIKVLKDEIITLTKTITQQQTKIKLLENQIGAQKQINEELEKSLDDQINRSMRNNLILKHIPEEEHESWDTTKDKVGEFLEGLTGINREKVKDNIERAHHGGKKMKNRHRNIFI